jgi:hypothetical protein
MKLGAEPRKLALLGGLVVAAIILFVYNSGDSGSTPSNAARATRAVSTPAASTVPLPREHRRTATRGRDRKTLRMQEVTTEAQQGSIDPTLRLDLLARLKNVKFSGAARSLFETGPAELPPQLANKVTVMPGPQPQEAAAAMQQRPVGPPQPPPITLKFYGFSAPATANGPRKGFFLDGDDVVIANEGETVKGRYHIVSLQPKAAEVEDLTTKSKQSLPIASEGSAGGA